MVLSVRRSVASKEHRRADRRTDQGEEKVGANALLVVDRGRRSPEDVATFAAKKRAVACGASHHLLAVAGQLM